MFVPKSDMTVKVYEQQNAINKDWHLERYFITEEYANKLSGLESKVEILSFHVLELLAKHTKYHWMQYLE